VKRSFFLALALAILLVIVAASLGSFAAPAQACYKAHASVSNTAPPVSTDVTLHARLLKHSTPIRKATAVITWGFQSGDVTATLHTNRHGRVSNVQTVPADQAGVLVSVTVTFTWKGHSRTATVSFTPVAGG
jgi:hypothetical protein